MADFDWGGVGDWECGGYYAGGGGVRGNEHRVVRVMVISAWATIRPRIGKLALFIADSPVLIQLIQRFLEFTGLGFRLNALRKSFIPTTSHRNPKNMGNSSCF